MEPMSDGPDNEALKLVKQLIETTGQTMQSHKTELEKINANLTAALAVMSNHWEAIKTLRHDQEGLCELVNVQSRLLESMRSLVLKQDEGFKNHKEVLESVQAAILKLHTHCFGPDDPPTPPAGTVN